VGPFNSFQQLENADDDGTTAVGAGMLPPPAWPALVGSSPAGNHLGFVLSVLPYPDVKQREDDYDVDIKRRALVHVLLRPQPEEMGTNDPVLVHLGITWYLFVRRASHATPFLAATGDEFGVSFCV